LNILAKAIKHSLKGDSLQMNSQQSQMAIQSYLGDKQKQKSDAMLLSAKNFLKKIKTSPA